jgi:hypothetical protein
MRLIHGNDLVSASVLAKNSRLMRVDSAGDTHFRAAVVHPVTQAGSSPSSILSLQ